MPQVCPKEAVIASGSASQLRQAPSSSASCFVVIAIRADLGNPSVSDRVDEGHWLDLLGAVLADYVDTCSTSTLAVDGVADPERWTGLWSGEAVIGPLLGPGLVLPPSSGEGGAMAHPNEELVRRGYEAFNNADVETLRQLFADTTIFHEPGRSPISGDYEGLDQVLGFFGTLAERSGGTFRANLHDVLANDEHVVGLHSSDAERDGRQVRSPTVLVFHVRDGRIAETWSHHHDQHEFDEFWA
jgi:ketosteroid isomerase-like protein